MEPRIEGGQNAKDALAEMLANRVSPEKQREIITSLVNTEEEHRGNLAEEYADEIGVAPEYLLRAAKEEEENPTNLEAVA